MKKKSRETTSLYLRWQRTTFKTLLHRDTSQRYSSHKCMFCVLSMTIKLKEPLIKRKFMNDWWWSLWIGRTLDGLAYIYILKIMTTKHDFMFMIIFFVLIVFFFCYVCSSTLCLSFDDDHVSSFVVYISWNYFAIIHKWVFFVFVWVFLFFDFPYRFIPISVIIHFAKNKKYNYCKRTINLMLFFFCKTNIWAFSSCFEKRKIVRFLFILWFIFFMFV
jgi:hypothetical protein